jgi:hypothetical protein
MLAFFWDGRWRTSCGFDSGKNQPVSNTKPNFKMVMDGPTYWVYLISPVNIQEIRWNASDVHLIFWGGERVWDSFS